MKHVLRNTYYIIYILNATNTNSFKYKTHLSSFLPLQLLNNAVQLGKVNCVTERGVCQHEQIMSYPSLKLYLNRNQRQRFSSVITIQIRDYESMLQEIKPLLRGYDESLLAGIEPSVRKSFDIKHDEF